MLPFLGYLSTTLNTVTAINENAPSKCCDGLASHPGGEVLLHGAEMQPSDSLRTDPDMPYMACSIPWR